MAFIYPDVLSGTPHGQLQNATNLAGPAKADMMLTQSPMKSTGIVYFTAENTPDAAVAQSVERCFRKAYDKIYKPYEYNDLRTNMDASVDAASIVINRNNELACLIDAWPTLSETLRGAILAIVQIVR
ncbi:MAG: hypothetical protein M1472_02485 [Planctomycetes bacterium]|jgi:hypothetical protein|nr:hypothetical protein [Planctomycetota bacterium]